MHPIVERRRDSLIELCRRHRVRRLDVFGSATRAEAFDPLRSDVDFLVELGAEAASTADFLDLKDALEQLLDRPVDLVERQAVLASRNPIRRRRILGEAVAIYAA